jgi:hypothetical protein
LPAKIRSFGNLITLRLPTQASLGGAWTDLVAGIEDGRYSRLKTLIPKLVVLGNKSRGCSAPSQTISKAIERATAQAAFNHIGTKINANEVTNQKLDATF